MITRLTRRHRPAKIFALPLYWGVVLAASGCGVTLEDGYKPHSLDASPDLRRAYYASPFTDQANGGGERHAPGLRPGGG